MKKLFFLVLFCLCWLPSMQAQATGINNLTVIPRGNPGTRTSIEQRSNHHSSLEATGLFLPKGEELIINVTEVPENAEVKVGQWGEYDNVANITNGKLNFAGGTLKLVQGENRMTNTQTGGMVYINNLSDSQTLHVSLSGGKKVPFYIQGTSDAALFRADLENAVDVPFMELVNEHVIATIRIDRAKDIFLKENQVENFLTYAKETVELENQVADLDFDGLYSKHKAKQRLHIANPTTGAGALYCTNYYLGIHSKSTSDRTVFNSKPGQTSWGLFHEIGHSYQNPYYTWDNMVEVTVNIYSNYVQSHMAGLHSPFDAVESKNAINAYRRPVKRYFDNKAKDPTWSIEKEISANPSNYHFGVLGMYIGLERAFGTDFYPVLNRMYRTLPTDQLPKSNTDKQQMFVLLTSKLVKQDLTPYFDFWGIPITEQTRNKLDQLNFPVLEKEIWKDLLASEAEEQAGTYRISDQVQPVKSYPRATQKNQIQELKVQELNRLNVRDYFTDYHSEPVPSDVTDVVIENDSFWNLSTQTITAFIYNQLGVGEKIDFRMKVVPQDTYVMSGQRGVYMILDYDRVTKQLVAKGRNVKILENLPNNTYPIITIYDKNAVKKKEVSGLGSTYGTTIAHQLDKEQLAVGDIVEIYHKEASKRSMRYLNGSKISTTQDTYYYEITENGWIPTDLKPSLSLEDQTYQIGQVPLVQDFLKASHNFFGNDLLNFTWGTKQPKTMSQGISLSNYLQQQISVKAVASNNLSNETTATLNYQLNNAINITRHGGFGTFLIYDPINQKLNAQGADPYTLNGGNTDTRTPLVSIEVLDPLAMNKYPVIQAFNNTKASDLTNCVNQANLQLAVGDVIKITHARQNQAGLGLDEDTKKYVTKAMTAFIDHQKIDQFSGKSQYYLVTATGLELYQDPQELVGRVTIQYVNENGQPLQADLQLTGELGVPYTLSVPTFDKYDLKEAPAELTGNFSFTPHSYTFVYERRTGGQVQVSYVDEQGQQLAESEILSGKLDNTYQAAPQDIVGYQLKTRPDNQTGIFTDEAQSVVFVYEPVTGGAVTIKYQDEAGNELAADRMISGMFSEAFDIHPSAIDGWVVKNQPPNAVGVFTLEPQLIVFIYEKAQGAAVFVQYLNSQRELLVPAEQLSGKIGATYQTKPKTIAGWRLIESPINANGAFTSEIQYVNYLYEQKVQGSIQIHYQDLNGRALLPTETQSGELGTTYQVSPKTIKDYALKATVGDGNGTYTATSKTIVFRYESSLVHSLVVKYIDAATQNVLASVTLSGKSGATYTAPIKEIVGYTLDTAAMKQELSSLTGIFDGKQPAEIHIPYQKNVPLTNESAVTAKVASFSVKNTVANSELQTQLTKSSQETHLKSSETAIEQAEAAPLTDSRPSVSQKTKAQTEESKTQAKADKGKTTLAKLTKSKQTKVSQTGASYNWSWILIGALLILVFSGFGLYKSRLK